MTRREHSQFYIHRGEKNLSPNTRHSQNTTVITMSIWKHGFPTIRSGSVLFRYAYWDSYKASYHAINTGSIHRVALNKIWGEREKSGIWLSVVCPVAVCSKAIVRRHHARRVRAALATVFTEQGLDENGKVMAGQTSRLQGTLHVMIAPPILSIKSSQIRKDCATMVSKIIQRDQRGQPWSPTYRQQSMSGSNDSKRTWSQGGRPSSGFKRYSPT